MAKVLIVDDSSIDRFIIKKCLENNLHKVIGEASSGLEALELYRKLSPDIVFLDVIMPNDDGLKTLSDIMSLDKSANVVMCTASALQNVIIEAMQIGAKAFLVKPVTNESLIHAVQKALK